MSSCLDLNNIASNKGALKGFKAPKRLNTSSNMFNGVKRVPRKYKKKYSNIFSSRYDHLDLGQKLWYIIYLENPKYNQFLINYIIHLDSIIKKWDKAIKLMESKSGIPPKYFESSKTLLWK